MASSDKQQKPHVCADAVSGDDKEVTATLRDLVQAINADPTRFGAAKIRRESLEPLLRFVSRVSGLEIDINAPDEPIPIETFETLKFLFIENDQSGLQLFQMLAPPHLGGRPNMELHALGKIPRYEYESKTFGDLIKNIEERVDEQQRQKIDTIFLGPGRLLECVALENEEIVDELGSDPLELIVSELRAIRFDRLTAEIKKYIPIRASSRKPLAEQVYTHLRSLEFAHTVYGISEAVLVARVDRTIATPMERLLAFRREITPRLGPDMDERDPILSIAEIPDFIKAHKASLIELVQASIGSTFRSDRIGDYLSDVQKVLYCYLANGPDRPGLEAPVVSVFDLLAALCAVRYQVEVKTPYAPYWPGQTGVGDNPLMALKRDRFIEELLVNKYIPHGVMQFWHYRCHEIRQAFVKQLPACRAHEEFQEVRLFKYTECMRPNDIDIIGPLLVGLHQHCLRSARQIRGEFQRMREKTLRSPIG